jgi:hypothetical protein
VSIDISDLVAALHARRTGRGWIARCPAHQDRTPSLSLAECNGRLLVHCHAGCAQADVIAALRDRGLWQERHREVTRGREADPDWRTDLRSATWWRTPAEMLAEQALEELPYWHPERAGLTALLSMIRLGDAALVTEYRAWRARDPELTAAMARAGQHSDARVQRQLAVWIREGLQGEFSGAY